MKRMMVAGLFLALYAAPALAQGLTASPPGPEQLEAVLRKLAEENPKRAFCEHDCATFFAVRFFGSLTSGRVDFALDGAVAGELPAYVPLFGTTPGLPLGSAQVNGRTTPVYWSGGAYSIVAAPGPFAVRGSLSFVRGAGLTVTVPGPTGLVSLDVGDADIVGTGERRGVRNATYQLTPRATRPTEAQTERLRLSFVREFTLDRDRRFAVTVEARGAKPGEVIGIPLSAGENVEDLDAQVAHVRADNGQRHIDWVASGANASLSYAGRFAGERISLVAPSGSVKETWIVRCDDPYLCSLEGDAETAPGSGGHTYSPLPGQKLEVTWRELGPLSGIHTVAQQATLSTRALGQNLEQRLVVRFMSSSGSLVGITLPPDAVLSQFELDATAVPVLKDASGTVRVSLPSGDSTLTANWQVAGAAGVLLKPPAPRLSEPVGTLWQYVYPAPGRIVLGSFGMPGAPRVALWPNLAGALLVAALALWLGRRAQAPVVAPRLFVMAALGFAALSPLAVVPLVLGLVGTRWLAAAAPGSRFRAYLTVLLVAGVWLVAVGLGFATLETTLFSEQPFEVTSFVSGGEAPNDWGYGGLSFGSYLAGNDTLPVTLPVPHIVTAPLFLVRLLWGAWAVVLASFLWREGQLVVGALGRFWGRLSAKA